MSFFCFVASRVLRLATKQALILNAVISPRRLTAPAVGLAPLTDGLV